MSRLFRSVGPYQLDEALQWLRSQVYTDDLSAIQQLFKARPEFQRTPSLTGYVWSHTKERLLAPLAQQRPLPSLYQQLLTQLPETIEPLTSMLQQTDLRQQTQQHIVKLLTQVQHPNAIPGLLHALQQPSPHLRALARRALEKGVSSSRRQLPTPPHSTISIQDTAPPKKRAHTGVWSGRGALLSSPRKTMSPAKWRKAS